MSIEKKLTALKKNNLLCEVKSIFYDELDLDKKEDQEKLHRALNYLFGLEIKSTPEWVNEFKNCIKTKMESPLNNDFVIKTLSKNQIKKLHWRSDIIEPAKQKWRETNEALIKFYKKSKDIKNTIVYEAPPFQITITTSNDGTLQRKFNAAHIFDDNCTSNYASAIKHLSTQKDHSVKNILTNNNIGFFDVIPIPLPITSKMRKNWATHENYVIEGKRLFVHFFEWAKAEAIKSQLQNNDSNVDYAIGIPLNNAITLYEHFQKPENGMANFCDVSDPTKKSEEEVGLFLPLYKNCIIDTSNTPSGTLLKRVLERKQKSRKIGN